MAADELEIVKEEFRNEITRLQEELSLDKEEGLFFMIDYADMVTDEDAPNNFHIDNDIEKFEKLWTDKDISTYTLNDEVSGLEFTNAQDFNKTLKKHVRFFNLYFVEGEVALVVEQYLP